MRPKTAIAWVGKSISCQQLQGGTLALCEKAVVPFKRYGTHFTVSDRKHCNQQSSCSQIGELLLWFSRGVCWIFTERSLLLRKKQGFHSVAYWQGTGFSTLKETNCPLHTNWALKWKSRIILSKLKSAPTPILSPIRTILWRKDVNTYLIKECSGPVKWSLQRPASGKKREQQQWLQCL